MTLCSCTRYSRRDDTLRKRAWGCSIKIYIKSCNCMSSYLTSAIPQNMIFTLCVQKLYMDDTNSLSFKKMSILESYYSKLQRCLGSELIWKEIWVKDMIQWLVRSAWYDVQQNSNIPNTNIANLYGITKVLFSLWSPFSLFRCKRVSLCITYWIRRQVLGVI